jgi:hypothetical protein
MTARSRPATLAQTAFLEKLLASGRHRAPASAVSNTQGALEEDARVASEVD